MLYGEMNTKNIGDIMDLNGKIEKKLGKYCELRVQNSRSGGRLAKFE